MTKFLRGIFIIGASVVLLATAFSLVGGTFANAANGKDFNAGRIIDDGVFYNGNSLNTSQIQSFLVAKNPNCDYNGTQSAADSGYPNLTHAQLAQYKREGSHGFAKDTGYNAPPYKCLTKYSQTTPQMEAASGYCDGISAGTRTAAQIINDVAKACGINPQVLIVLLEKEQSLVTDNWPLNRQLRSATGFGCPDTAPCDPSYEGFFYQVYNAARQFKVYRANPDDYNYIAGRTNRIYWQTSLGGFVNPSGNANDPSRSGKSGCGYTNVFIQNQATAALYIYTPYQPNQKALANMNGTGDGCSAYGNRNFWRLFTDWFGSTHEAYNYSAETLVGAGGVIPNSISASESIKTLTPDYRIFTFYSDTSTQTLRFAYWNGSKWSDNILDGPGSLISGASTAGVNVGKIDAFMYKGEPQVFYYEKGSKTLRHLYVTKSGWAIETLDGSSSGTIKRSGDVGSEISGFTYGTNGIQLYYYNTTEKRLEHTWWDGKSWRNEALDGETWSIIGRDGDVGSEISGFTYGTNGIQLYYYNTTEKRLEHTWWDGKSWRNEALDGETWSIIGRDGDVGSEISGLVYDNAIQLFYYNKGSGELIHTWWNKKTQQWSSEVMDGDTNSVLGNYINAGKQIETAMLNGKLFVIYYDDATGFAGGRTSAWRLAYWSSSTWIQHTMDGGVNSSSGSSAAIPIGDISASPYQEKSLQIFYRGNSSQLRHFWVHK